MKKERVKEGTVVEFKRKNSDKTELICLCGRSDVGRHAEQHDCRLVSCDTPIGKAFIGKKVGDKVTVRAPGGQYQAVITAFIPSMPATDVA